MTTKRGTLLLAAVVAALALAVAGPASAIHDLELVHQPPPFAAQSQDLALHVAATSTCAPFCSPIAIEVHYLDAEGVEQLVTIETPDVLPAGAVTLTVPATAVHGPTFEYWVTAVQMRCVWSYDCHEAKAAVPQEGGVYTVPVTS